MDVTEFLAARLDEDERWTDPLEGFDWAAAFRDPLAARQRALREVAAGRAILARYEDCLIRQGDADYPTAAAREQVREYEDFVLPNLAAIYSGHPDYRDEWKP